MDQQQIVLVTLVCLGGKPCTPAQLQRAVFMIGHCIPALVEGVAFDFSFYDYGMFDPAVFARAKSLEVDGDATISVGGVGRWRSYDATDAGRAKAARILEALDDDTSRMIRDIVHEACSGPRPRSRFRKLCKCPEC
jgi:hypothetical protein